VIVHVARLDPMKDHATLLAALDRLPHVHAVLAGLGTETLTARPRLHRLGVRDDVPRLLAAADLFVSSSAFGEGFSNALAEAMAAGLTPVATDVGDARAIVGDCGFVVPPRDPAALAEAIAAALAGPARGATARARMLDRFTIAASAARFVALQESA
jgi:glycosyltransferase involved in cell wall biosynthesis